MKALIFSSTLVLTLFANTIIGQDIPQSQVPSIILNHFQQSFPKAFHVEWEMQGDIYDVDFETGLLGLDHEVWYDKTGKLVRHKEEISKSDLPKKVTAKIKSDYKGYRVDDVKKITESDKVFYTLELHSLTKEWKVAFDPEGNILSQFAD